MKNILILLLQTLIISIVVLGGITIAGAIVNWALSSPTAYIFILIIFGLFLKKVLTFD